MLRSNLDVLSALARKRCWLPFWLMGKLLLIGRKKNPLLQEKHIARGPREILAKACVLLVQQLLPLRNTEGLPRNSTAMSLNDCALMLFQESSVKPIQLLKTSSETFGRVAIIRPCSGAWCGLPS